jgi:hypothetical protein
VKHQYKFIDVSNYLYWLPDFEKLYGSDMKHQYQLLGYDHLYGIFNFGYAMCIFKIPHSGGGGCDHHHPQGPARRMGTETGP